MQASAFNDNQLNRISDSQYGLFFNLIDSGIQEYKNNKFSLSKVILINSSERLI